MHAVCHDVFDNNYLYYESTYNYIYTMNFTNYSHCIVYQFPYHNVAAASFMYSTYVHCLHCVVMLLKGAWPL